MKQLPMKQKKSVKKPILKRFFLINMAITKFTPIGLQANFVFLTEGNYNMFMAVMLPFMKEPLFYR